MPYLLCSVSLSLNPCHKPMLAHLLFLFLVMQGNINCLLMRENLINGDQASLMVGILLAYLTINGPCHLKSCLTFPSLVLNRQQPATDSDAWDTLSHIDHPGRVFSQADAHKYVLVVCVGFVLTLLCYFCLQTLKSKYCINPRCIPPPFI